MVGLDLAVVLFKIFLPQYNLPGVFIHYIFTINNFVYSQFVSCACILGTYFEYVKGFGK